MRRSFARIIATPTTMLTRSLATCFNWGVSRRVAEEWMRDCARRDPYQQTEPGRWAGSVAGGAALRAAEHLHDPSHADARHICAPSWHALRDFIARRQLEKYEGILVSVQATREQALRAFHRGRSAYRDRAQWRAVGRLGLPCIPSGSASVRSLASRTTSSSCSAWDGWSPRSDPCGS